MLLKPERHHHALRLTMMMPPALLWYESSLAGHVGIGDELNAEDSG